MALTDRPPFLASQLSTPNRKVLDQRRWGDELVIFDRQTGDTHALSGLCGYAFEIICRAPRSIDDLRSELILSRQIDDPEVFLEEVDRALSDLRQRGLVS